MPPPLLDVAAAIARHHPRLSRRDVLELAALTPVLAACRGRARSDEPLAAAPAEPAARDAGPASALDGRAFRALEAAVARILPTTPSFTGAREARAIDFIDRQLSIAPLARIAPAMVALAHALDAQARARRAGDFAALAPAAQDEVLEQLARGAWTGDTLPQRELFRVLHGLTLEGFLADPAHGGNRDGVGWAAVGFPEPPLRRPGGGHGGHGGH